MQLMIAVCNAPSFYVGSQAVLSLFSSGRTTCIVFDAGDLISHKVPISENYSLPQAFMLPNLTEWLHFDEVCGARNCPGRRKGDGVRGP
jgi:hypothetical protein